MPGNLDLAGDYQSIQWSAEIQFLLERLRRRGLAYGHHGFAAQHDGINPDYPITVPANFDFCTNQAPFFTATVDNSFKLSMGSSTMSVCENPSDAIDVTVSITSIDAVSPPTGDDAAALPLRQFLAWSLGSLFSAQ